MFIAQELRKRNIAEYLLYMWQMEDLIRAYDCSLSRIKTEYLSRFDYSEDQLAEATDWYGNLIRMMNSEGKREHGHLQINEVILSDMSELNERLLSSSKFPFYSAQYYKVLPFVIELRNKTSHPEDEIETCMNALYGVMLLRLQKKEVSDETSRAVKEITTFIGMLSDYYASDKTGSLVFDD